MKIEVPKEIFDHKIGVACVGYNSRAEIKRCMDGFVGHVETMILGDGKYDFYPGDKDYSEDGWLDYAEKLYKDKVEFIGYQLAGKQVDKRQRYLDLAGKTKCDFLICIDTDDYIMEKYQDWDKFYFQLFTLSEVTTDRIFYKWVWVPNSKLWPKQGNQFPTGWRKSVRVHKDPGTMRYCLDTHYIWCDKKISDNKIVKWQLKHRGESNPYQFEPRNVIDGVRDTMDRTLRTKEQIKAGAEWAHQNQHAENSRKYYKIAKVIGTPPPPGYTWEQWEKKPHTFDKKTGMRIEL
jgi:hypothetical protein